MKNIISYIVFAAIPFFFVSCYTLNTHQTAKTLGTGEVSIQGIAGISGIPKIKNDPNNVFSDGYSTTQAQIAIGIKDNIDVGVTLGFNKLGVLSKYQFIGDQESRFAMASGLYLYKSQGNMIDYYNMAAVEVPIFLSYHPNKYVGIYSNPMLTFYDIEADGLISLVDEQFYKTGTYKGLSSGVIFTFPLGLDDFRVSSSVDVSWISPLHSNRYLFFTTLGIGIKLNTGWFQK